MKIYAVCGSPRKRWNDDQLLDAFVEGVHEAAPDTEVEKVHIYDYQFTGCKSCFGCKLAKGDGNCVIRDDIHDLLVDMRAADGMAFAAPIYFCDVAAQMRAFLERLMYPGSMGREYPVQAIYTMNMNEEAYEHMVKPTTDVLHSFMKGNFGSAPEVLCAFDTMQRKVSNRYKPSKMDHARKVARHDEVWPSELERAREAGRRYAARLAEVVAARALSEEL